MKFFSVFLCQRCREIWREILVKFSVLRFPGFGCARENFTKISRQKRCGNGKFHANFTLLGRSADNMPFAKGTWVNRFKNSLRCQKPFVLECFLSPITLLKGVNLWVQRKEKFGHDKSIEEFGDLEE